MKKIILIGFAACYKSHVGKLLADKLNCAFVDTDREIECRCGMTVRQIFETMGEGYFRAMENALLLTLNDNNTVVACGGGSVMSHNFDNFAYGGTVVCLTATAETVHSRLGDGSRPLFDGITVEQLNSFMQQRALLYAKYANATFDTDGKTSQQVADQVYEWLITGSNINR